MFNPLRKIFSRRGNAAVEAAREFRPVAARPAAPAPAPVYRANPPQAARADLQSVRPAPAPVNVPASLGISLKAILTRLPAELMQRVRQLDVGEAEIFIPMQKILGQIASGSVKISFGELRQVAPPGTFNAENDRDRVLVDLPLQEILGRLNPALLTRRPAQKHVEVPAEVPGPFGGQAPVTISSTPVKPAVPLQPTTSRPPQPAARPAPAYQPSGPAMPVVQAPFPVLQPSAVPPRPAVASPMPSAMPIAARIRNPQMAPAVAMAAPAAAVAVEENVFQKAPAPMLWSQEENYSAPAPVPAAPVAPATPAFRAPAPVPAPVVTPISPALYAQSGDTEVIRMPDTFSRRPADDTPISPIAPAPEPEPTPIPFATQFAEEPAEPEEPEMPSFSGETRFLTISLADLSLSWPEAVRQEIHTQHLFNTLIGLPMGAVEGVIKSGKVAFPWKALRSWIKPPVPPSPSAYDTTMLELPLKVVTPLFLNELKGSRPQRRVAVDATIPNLFSGTPSVESVVPAAAPMAPPPPAQMGLPVQPVQHAPAAPTPVFVAAAMAASPAPIAASDAAKTADTNYFSFKETEGKPDETAVFTRKDGKPGTAFLNRYATPNEIVNKAAAFNGVDGALIALPDGLLVASRIPASMNADTIAAFLPQIFGRVSQCTRELRLGELNNLNFTVGNVPWKIFRVGSIYFAVFGRPGEALPTAQLVGLAAELDRKAK